MSLRVFRAKVSRVTDLTHDVRELDLDLVSPSEITFSAGQFISFEIWPVGGSRPVTRPYSIASPPATVAPGDAALQSSPGRAGVGIPVRPSAGRRGTVQGRGRDVLPAERSWPRRSVHRDGHWNRSEEH